MAVERITGGLTGRVTPSENIELTAAVPLRGGFILVERADVDDLIKWLVRKSNER